MRAKLPLLFVVLCCLTLAAAPTAQSRAARTHARNATVTTRDIVGTWEIVWPATTPSREIKLITPTHFTWTTYDPGSHRVLASGGGAYTLIDGVYCEQLDFAQGDIESAAGRVLCFRLRVQGDTLQQLSASAGESPSVREIWRRVR